MRDAAGAGPLDQITPEVADGVRVPAAPGRETAPARPARW